MSSYKSYSGKDFSILKVEIFLIIVLAINITFIGCKEQEITWEEIDRPYATSKLKHILEHRYNSDFQKRAQEALLKLDDKVIDTYPILVWAILRRELDNTYLSLLYFDEGRDIRGFRVKELHQDPNGEVTTIIEEDYPIFLSVKPATVGDHRGITVEIRNKNQYKNELSWLKYENKVLDAFLDKYVAKGSISKPNNAVKIPDEHPKIYISVPKPNSVKVDISVYDKEGNESNWVKLELVQDPEINE
jgi:hypothetical protein